MIRNLANSVIWNGKPPVNEMRFQNSLADYIKNQYHAAEKWAAHEAQTITRCIPEGEGTAASYLEHRRDQPSERLDVKRERLLRRLREGQHKTAGFARVRPTTYAKPWGRESRHSLRKKALSRAMLVDEIALAGDGVEPTPYSAKLGAVLWGV
jgi:hypothetical protein